MSEFLPYGKAAGSRSWGKATGLALLAHGSALAMWFNLTQLSFEPPSTTSEHPEFVITVQPFEIEAPAGIEEFRASLRAEESQDEPDRQIATTTSFAVADATSQQSEQAPVTAVPAPPPLPAQLPPIPISPVTPQTGIASIPEQVEADLLRPQIVQPLRPGITLSAMSAVELNPPSATSLRPEYTPTPQDLMLSDLIRRIRVIPADPCLVALPRRDGPKDIGLALLAQQERAMEQFAEELLTSQDGPIPQARALVDPRQCPALTFLRELQDYPATRPGLSLDAADIPQGGRLTGLVNGIGGRYLLLLLIDNNGVVQDMQRFITFSGNQARYDIPVTRNGALRDTKQILLALVTDRPAPQLRARMDRLAQDVFAGMSDGALQGASFALGLFDVR